MIKKVFLLLVAVLALASCSKEQQVFTPKNDRVENVPSTLQKIPLKEDLSLNSVTQQNGMLVFKSVEHFFAATEDISKLNELERLSFERKLSFSSFGTIADKFYEKIDFDKLANKQQLNSFIKQHSIMLQIERVNSNDKILETGLNTLEINENVSVLPANFFDTERWLMNNNKMYIIDGGVYKHFNSGMVVVTSASSDNNVNIENLKNASLDSWAKFENNKNFIVYKYDVTDDVILRNPPIANIVFPDQPTPPTHHKKIERIGYSKNGRNRIRVIMKCGVYYHMSLFSNNPSGHNVRLKTTVINERKGKMLIFFTKWYNTYYQTNGYIKVNTRHSGFNIRVGSYDDIFLTPTENININYSLKDNTWTKNIGFYPIPPRGIIAKKPWIRIIDWSIRLNVENGAYLNEY